jgi:hypothetical protein
MKLAHHRGEEELYFPKLEAACGEKGLMDVNVEQHRKPSPVVLIASFKSQIQNSYKRLDEFESGIEAYKTYLLSLKGAESTFSAAKLLSIIDGFSASLTKHLSDEIPTLEALSRFGSSVPFLTLSEVEMRKASGSLPKTEYLPFFFFNMDRTFEGGLWEYWPPIPGPVRWILARVMARKHAGWWRFASCDYDGMPQKLYATG